MDAPADAVAARARPEEHDLVAGAGGVRELQVFVAQHPDGEGVDKRIALVDGVEHRLAADVRKAQAVAVGGDARDDAVHDARGVGWSIAPKRSWSMTATGRAPSR